MEIDNAGGRAPEERAPEERAPAERAPAERAPAERAPAEPPSPIAFRLDPRSGVPTYLQLVHQVEHALQLGRLQLGDQLPRVKDVVASLSINPNTVLKAYQMLESKGIVAGRPGQGTFVTAVPDIVSLERLAALRRSLLTGWLSEAAAAGLDEDAIVALFTSTLADLRSRPASAEDRIA